MDLIKIDGWRGAGKSVLWTLLDGHDGVFCSPFHDGFFEPFMTENKDAEWLKFRDPRTLRRFINSTNYYLLELHSWNKFINLDFTSKEKRLSIPFEFNFYDFDRDFFCALRECEDWTIERIIRTFYATLKEHCRTGGTGGLENTKYVAAMGSPISWEHNNFSVNLPRAKCIQVRRDPYGILATISNRRPLDCDFRSRVGYHDDFRTRMKRSEVEKILNFYEHYDRLVEKYPRRFLILNFKEIVTETQAVMKKVARFLNIDFREILTKCTFRGEELTCGGTKYVGSVLDEPETLLSRKELNEIRLRINLYKIHGSRNDPFSLNFLRSIINKIRHKNKY